MPYPSELILLPSLKAQRGGKGGFVLTQKFVNGVAAYARSWPGPVTTLIQVNTTPTTDMDHVEVFPAKLPFGLEERPGAEDVLARRLEGAAVVLAFLCPEEAPTAELCARLGLPLVYSSEYSLHTEKQIIDAEYRNPLRRWRRKWWVTQAEKKRIAALRLAAGIQCSGAPTYDVYRHHNGQALLFFDNRVPMADVISEEQLEARLETMRTRPALNLVFGGRLIEMKGVRYLPRVASSLKTQGIPFKLRIYGTGLLAPRLAQDIRELGLEQDVTLEGALDFQHGWVPMLKQEADVFVCCHTQGDPSSIYPEVMACGVPIVGFANEAFEGIVRHGGSGWLCPVGDPGAVAGQIARLHRDREEIAAAAVKARAFGLAHAFEPTFAARVRHMVRCSRLIPAVKDVHLAATSREGAPSC